MNHLYGDTIGDRSLQGRCPKKHIDGGTNEKNELKEGVFIETRFSRLSVPGKKAGRGEVNNSPILSLILLLFIAFPLFFSNNLSATHSVRECG